MFFIAIFAGLLAGWIRTLWLRTSWQLPDFRHGWAVVLFFVPQFLAFYLPATRGLLSQPLASACLIVSQLGLLAICLANLRLPGMALLAGGLFLNLLAIALNGGLMPLSTTTAAYLLPGRAVSDLQVGGRFGVSKDILLAPETIQLPWLADRLTPPAWIPYRFAFSLGDVLVALGSFLLLAFPTQTEGLFKEG